MRACALIIWLLCLPVFVLAQEVAPAVQEAQQAPQTFDKEAFDKLVKRAEGVVDRGVASDQALESLRKQLADYRTQANRQKQEVSFKLRPLEDRLAALGDPPGEGGQEASDVAALRAQLTAELDRTRAPFLAAEDANRQADALIKAIDETIRGRATDALLERGPSPVNPARWASAVTELRGYFRSVRGELTTTWSSESRRAARISNAPIVLIMIGLALLLLFRARRWSRLGQDFLSTGVSARSAAGFGLLGALLQIALPALGLWVLVRAIDIFDVFSVRGYFLVAALGMAGFALYFATWVSRLLFVPSGHLPALVEVSQSDRRTLRNAFTLLGLVFAVRQMLGAVQGALDTEPALAEATTTLMFPVVVLGGLGIFQIGWALRRLARQSAENEGGNPFLARVATLMGTFCLMAGILGPVASAVGYAQAGTMLVFSTALSLLMIAGFYILFRLLGMMIGASVPKSAGDGQEETVRFGALFQITLGFLFICTGVPLLALIWGMRESQLFEIWVWLNDGVAIGDTRVSLTDFLRFILVFSVGYMLTRLLQTALRTTVMPNTRFDIGGQNAIVTGTGYVGIFLAALAAIGATEIDLSNLAIVAGALSVGIGFGLQTIVSNFVSGIILLIERPIKSGDWIEVGAYSGYVRKISVRSTEIETFDRANVIIPNADLIAGSVTNWTHSSMAGRVLVPVGVSYDSDPRHVEKILREVAESHPMVILNPPPVVMFMGFGADSLDFEIRAILRDVNWMLSARSDLNFEIAKRFREEGIEIPFAQRDVYIKNLGDLQAGRDEAGDAPTA